jgi:hypothetical protein
VYPISLKYDSQKTFTKVNILVPWGHLWAKNSLRKCLWK